MGSGLSNFRFMSAHGPRLEERCSKLEAVPRKLCQLETFSEFPEYVGTESNLVETSSLSITQRFSELPPNSPASAHRSHVVHF